MVPKATHTVQVYSFMYHNHFDKLKNARATHIKGTMASFTVIITESIFQ